MIKEKLNELAKAVQDAINPTPELVHKFSVSLLEGNNDVIVLSILDTSTDLHGYKIAQKKLDQAFALASTLVESEFGQRKKLVISPDIQAVDTHRPGVRI